MSGSSIADYRSRLIKELAAAFSVAATTTETDVDVDINVNTQQTATASFHVGFSFHDSSPFECLVI